MECIEQMISGCPVFSLMSLNPSQIFLFENQYCHNPAHFSQRKVFNRLQSVVDQAVYPLLKSQQPSVFYDKK